MGKFRVFIAVILLLTLLCGCEIDILETDNPPTLPKLDIGASELTGTVEYINGRTCRIHITAGDSHFKAGTEDREPDVIQISYTSLEGAKTVKVGDTITFRYHYTEDVSELYGYPHISVNSITVKS
jgi:hypothetical protein